MEETKDISNWVDRLVDEEKQLHLKMIALKTAIDNGKVPEEEVEILNVQLSAMTTYAYVIRVRLAKAKSNK